MPEHPAIVGAIAPDASRAAAGASKRPRRRFVTDPTDTRLFRVCRWPRPVAGSERCRCGGALDATSASRTGYRHRPATRRPRPAVHVDDTRELTLSAVPGAPRSGAGPATPPVVRDDPRHITFRGPLAALALASAVADHLSPRAAAAIAEPCDELARAQRIGYVADALARALRCPLCGPDLVAAGVCRG